MRDDQTRKLSDYTRTFPLRARLSYHLVCYRHGNMAWLR